MTALEELRAHATERDRHDKYHVHIPLTLEQRLDDSADGFSLTGHAAVFGQLSENLGGFREKIKRGAFRKALSAERNVVALWEHDARWLLASTRAGTLVLREDPKGLRASMDVAPTSYADDLRTLVERGDLHQMSFGFTVATDEWHEKDGEVLRTITEIDRLFDVSAVAMPAYPQTDLAANSLDPELVLRAMHELHMSTNASSHQDVSLIVRATEELPLDGLADVETSGDGDDSATRLDGATRSVAVAKLRLARQRIIDLA